VTGMDGFLTVACWIVGAAGVIAGVRYVAVRSVITRLLDFVAGTMLLVGGTSMIIGMVTLDLDNPSAFSSITIIGGYIWIVFATVSILIGKSGEGR
jgi:hypothetical protein